MDIALEIASCSRLNTLGVIDEALFLAMEHKKLELVISTSRSHSTSCK